MSLTEYLSAADYDLWCVEWVEKKKLWEEKICNLNSNFSKCDGDEWLLSGLIFILGATEGVEWLKG